MIAGAFGKRIYKAAIFGIAAVCTAALLAFPKEAADGARTGLSMCADVIIPSLFPFFAVSSLAVELGFADAVGNIAEGFMRLAFRLPGTCAPAFVLGLIGGYPAGAKTAVSLYKKGVCTKEETEQMLAFCNNSGPAFILGAVGVGMLRSAAAGLMLYASHILAAASTGLIFRIYGRSRTQENSAHINARDLHDIPPFSSALVSSVNSAFTSMLSVCAFVVFFASAIEILTAAGVISAAADAVLAVAPSSCIGRAGAVGIISGLVEMNSGLIALCSSGAPPVILLSAASFLIGWGGLSVHFQSLSFIAKCGLSPLPHTLGKLLTGLLSAAYTALLSHFIPVYPDTAVWLPYSSGVRATLSFFPNAPFFASLFMWILLIIPSAVVYMRQKHKKKAHR